MESLFQGCSNLISLNLSNFNESRVTSMRNMFDGCNKLEYVNLINAKINQNKIFDSICSNPPPYLCVCTGNEDWPKIFDLSDKQYVNCINNNISNFNINENELIKCYKRDIDSDNPCQICGNNYFNNSCIINNTYINCCIDDTSYLV